MPISLDTGDAIAHSHSWSFLVKQDSHECSEAVALLLGSSLGPISYNYGQQVETLAEALDQDRRTALHIAKSGPLRAIDMHLISNSGYEVNN